MSTVSGMVEVDSQQQMVEDAITADAFAARVREYMDSTLGPFVGTAQELFAALLPALRPQGWPWDPAQLVSRLRRVAPMLRASGLLIDFPDHSSPLGPSSRLYRLEVSMDADPG